MPAPDNIPPLPQSDSSQLPLVPLPPLSEPPPPPSSSLPSLPSSPLLSPSQSSSSPPSGPASSPPSGPASSPPSGPASSPPSGPASSPPSGPASSPPSGPASSPPSGPASSPPLSLQSSPLPPGPPPAISPSPPPLLVRPSPPLPGRPLFSPPLSPPQRPASLSLPDPQLFPPPSPPFITPVASISYYSPPPSPPSGPSPLLPAALSAAPPAAPQHQQIVGAISTPLYFTTALIGADYTQISGSSTSLSAFNASFTAATAAALGVSTHQISVISISPGSVIVNASVSSVAGYYDDTAPYSSSSSSNTSSTLPASSASSSPALPTIGIQVIQAALEAYQSDPVATLGTSSFMIKYGVTSVQISSPPAPEKLGGAAAAPSPPGSSRSGVSGATSVSYATIGIVVGLGIGVISLLVAAVVIWKRRHQLAAAHYGDAVGGQAGDFANAPLGGLPEYSVQAAVDSFSRVVLGGNSHQQQHHDEPLSKESSTSSTVPDSSATSGPGLHTGRMHHMMGGRESSSSGGGTCIVLANGAPGITKGGGHNTNNTTKLISLKCSSAISDGGPIAAVEAIHQLEADDIEAGMVATGACSDVKMIVPATAGSSHSSGHYPVVSLSSAGPINNPVFLLTGSRNRDRRGKHNQQVIALSADHHDPSMVIEDLKMSHSANCKVSCNEEPNQLASPAMTDAKAVKIMGIKCQSSSALPASQKPTSGKRGSDNHHDNDRKVLPERFGGVSTAVQPAAVVNSGGTSNSSSSALGCGFSGFSGAGPSHCFPAGGSSGEQQQPSAGSIFSAVQAVASTIPLIQACIAVANQAIAAADRVVANHARCERLAIRINNLLPALRALHRKMENDPGSSEADEHLNKHLGSISRVLVRCKDCITRWTQDPKSKLKVLANMFSSSEFQQEFLDLNSSISDAVLDLNLSVQLIKGAGVFSMLETPSTTEKIEAGQQYQLDLQRDLDQFAELISREGGWKGLSREDQRAVADFYKSKGLDLDDILSQTESHARADMVSKKVDDLMYILWEDIKAPRNNATTSGGGGGQRSLATTANGTAGSSDQQLEFIGQGGYGKVYRGRWQGQDVAVKKMEFATSSKAKEELSREAYIMSTCTHPHIAKCFGLSTEPSTGVPALVMKYYPRGTLLEVLQEAGPGELTTVLKLRMALNVARGMAYLHCRPNERVVHGDLKTANLLVDTEYDVYITDFGLAKMQTITRTLGSKSSARSVLYTPPEVLEDPNSLRAASGDVYAFAMVLLELFTRKMPFSGANEGQIWQWVVHGKRPSIPVSTAPSTISITSQQQEVLQMKSCNIAAVLNDEANGLLGGRSCNSLAEACGQECQNLLALSRDMNSCRGRQLDVINQQSMPSQSSKVNVQSNTSRPEATAAKAASTTSNPNDGVRRVERFNDRDMVPLSVASLIKRCWSQAPNNRPTFQAISAELIAVVRELALEDDMEIL
ncbi:hypothetical protein CEUSTIGMA_g11698.t1 [Chlamydomonas eustigma]|uniref:Protein kinase domain-containing protein n=1 Tax=Chlamydomonas eustigma TaxID=1157962 RepID=A0A250XMN1_9CHLO|nr:hypothetical protein CEUSTIGMA_g11698.t1 [Chlamydomonas eustigma]|eukprot:GAX84276.1 hypothetical protein CEUSTIGMA_g11698.t1 [Chlamydomonas eustigma]